MEKLYRFSHEIQFKNTIFTIIYIYQCVMKNNSKRLLFFAQEVSKSAVSFRGVFIEKKQIGLSKNKDRNVRPIFLEFF